MKTTLYRSKDRGSANYGWLQAKYSFSFANYYNPTAINFGALRVLNDDVILGGYGFGNHPHDNMEIITIPLSGTLKHKDSMSNKWIPLETGEVQVMSAGTGIIHSEMNNSSNVELSLFQIWIIPNKRDVQPRYDQKTFSVQERDNDLQYLVSNIDNPIKGSLAIHQNAIISRIDLDENKEFNYNVSSPFNGVYTMLIDGEIQIEDKLLHKRDAIGIEQTDSFKIKTLTQSQLLFIEVPMK